jgi:hypothetical protein
MMECMLDADKLLRRSFLSLPLALAAPGPLGPARMLWAGSSGVYYHNLPRVTAEWLTQYGKTRIFKSEIAGRSGEGIHVYLKPDSFKAEYGLDGSQSILEKIATGKYTHVVLQTEARFLVGSTAEDHLHALEVYCKAVREAGGEPVYYEAGWGLGNSEDAGRARILESAKRNQLRLFVPCSTAWKRVRAERPELELHNPPDESHPGTLGHYLNLCCFFAAFLEKHPKALPLDYLVWLPLSDRDQAAADNKLAGAPTRDPYLLALPDFLKRRAIMAEPYTMDKAVGRYFQNVAWESWRDAQKALKAG